MEIPFRKYEGCGNDFIMADNRKSSIHLNQHQVALLCHRHFGIGADGLILLEQDPESDFYMRYYNSDGRESTFCGNGGRCAASFASLLDIFEGSKTRFRAKDGFHEAEIGLNSVRLKMLDTGLPEKYEDGYFLFTGSPHLVLQTKNIDLKDVYGEGKRRREKHSPEGVNVNFMQQGEGHIRIRTYERGVENETLSCGTGVTAAALLAGSFGFESPVMVETPGGKLSVEFQQKSNGFSEIYLNGAAREVFSGTISIT